MGGGKNQTQRSISPTRQLNRKYFYFPLRVRADLTLDIFTEAIYISDIYITANQAVEVWSSK